MEKDTGVQESVLERQEDDWSLNHGNLRPSKAQARTETPKTDMTKI